VRVEWRRADRYGRLLGTVWIDGVNINEFLVRSGHAWRYRYARKTGAIADAERFARENRLGLWRAGGVVEPWVHRAKRR
jgi:micrococcal nuclease